MFLPALLRPLCCFGCMLAGLVVSTAGAAAPIGFQKLQLSDVFYSEGAAFGDLNRDGILDVVSGPYWYEGPTFKQRHEYSAVGAFDPNHYSDNFFAFVHDFNGDGWADILVIGFPGTDASWFENPGQGTGTWRRHVAALPVDNESAGFGDLLGHGQPVLICSQGGRLGYATLDPKIPTGPWVFHPISPPGPWQRFTHGLGFGDINGDGRPDLIEKSGWWEQPASLRGDPVWVRHPFPFAPGRGGAQMYAFDVNGDGLADVVTAKSAHGYGLSWFEQKRSGDGNSSFIEHRILSENAEEKLAGVQFSQPHAMAIADIDGDGLPDLVTGKRWWAHGPKGDVDAGAEPVLYAFLLRREANGTAHFEPHLIDRASGVGTQVVTADANGDGRPDIVVGNKRGTFVFLSSPAAKR